jgi:DNA-binding PadR family transcriptional regulator
MSAVKDSWGRRADIVNLQVTVLEVGFSTRSTIGRCSGRSCILDGYIAYRYSEEMTNSESSLTGLGRNAAAAVLVLSSLAGGDKHGYALVSDVEEFAGVHLPPGTLYQLLARLESRGLITALEADERRRPYRLTAQGATVLAKYITAQQRILKTGQARLKRSWKLA